MRSNAASWTCRVTYRRLALVQRDFNGPVSYTHLDVYKRQGLARIVTPERATPLVDRALTAIYRVLQRFTGRTAEPR